MSMEHLVVPEPKKVCKTKQSPILARLCQKDTATDERAKIGTIWVKKGNSILTQSIK